MSPRRNYQQRNAGPRGLRDSRIAHARLVLPQIKLALVDDKFVGIVKESADAGDEIRCCQSR